jgi:Phosphatidylglycerophosphate synthase
MGENLKSRNKNLTVPNAISVLRIIFVPFFAYFFLKDNLEVATIILVFSGFTDLFDGIIARKFNQITELGKMLDPLADKLTQAAVAFCMAVRVPQVRIFLIIFIAKELVMLAGAIQLLSKKKKPCSAKWYGKVATTCFYISVTVIVLMSAFELVSKVVFAVTANVLLFITAVFMVYALYKYLKIFQEIMGSDAEEYSFSLHEEIRKKETIERKTKN